MFYNLVYKAHLNYDFKIAIIFYPGGVMKFFQLCLMVTLLGFGAACSKKLNTRSKEIIAKENLAKDQKAANELASKSALEAKTAEEKNKAEQEKIDREFEAKKANAVSLTSILSNVSTTDANLEIYQLLLTSHINKSSQLLKITEDDSSLSGVDFKSELSDVKAKTSVSSETICKTILEKIASKDQSDLISLDKNMLTNDVIHEMGCIGFNIKSNYITVKATQELCTQTIVESRKSEVSKIETLKIEVKPLEKTEVKINPPVTITPKAKSNESVNDQNDDEQDQSELDMQNGIGRLGHSN